MTEGLMRLLLICTTTFHHAQQHWETMVVGLIADAPSNSPMLLGDCSQAACANTKHQLWHRPCEKPSSTILTNV